MKQIIGKKGCLGWRWGVVSEEEKFRFYDAKELLFTKTKKVILVFL